MLAACPPLYWIVPSPKTAAGCASPRVLAIEAQPPRLFLKRGLRRQTPRSIRTALSAVEPSLKQQNPDIRNSRLETRAQNLRERLENADFPAAETGHSDDSGWLRSQYCANLSRGINSLISGKNTGKFADSEPKWLPTKPC